jgi:hypothetical protein
MYLVNSQERPGGFAVAKAGCGFQLPADLVVYDDTFACRCGNQLLHEIWIQFHRLHPVHQQSDRPQVLREAEGPEVDLRTGTT